MNSKAYYESLKDIEGAVAELRAAFDLLWYNSALGFGDTHPITEATFLCAARVIGSHLVLDLSEDDWSGVWQSLIASLSDAYSGDMREGVMEQSFRNWIIKNEKYLKYGIQN